MARVRKSLRLLSNSAHLQALALAENKLEEGGVCAFDAKRLFGRDAPLEVEIGAGKGDFIVERARATPGHDFLAIELAASTYRWLATRCLCAGLANLRAVRADARSVVNLMLPAAGVEAFHIYFPDPWPKNRHSKHRLFSPAFAVAIARALRPGGALHLATDVRNYFHGIAEMMAAEGLTNGTGAAPEPATHFGRKWRAAGRPIYAAMFVRPASSPEPPADRL